MIDHSLDYPATVLVEWEIFELLVYLRDKTFEDLRLAEMAHEYENLLDDMIAIEVGAALEELPALDYLIEHLHSHLVCEHLKGRLDHATPV